MSNYSALKTDINNNIYENNTQQITGTVLNTVLKDMVNTLGAGYQFAGCAYLDLNPGAPDAKVFYLAGEGLYTNFDNIQVPAGKLGILKWDTRWHLETIEGLGGGGANLTGYISVASTDDLPDVGQPTIGYLCGTNLYLYVGEGGDTKEGKYQDCGGFRGPEGVGITEIEQVEQSTANGGRNTIRIHLSNGSSYDVYTRNGTTSTGLFPTLAALQTAHPSPVVGQYAFVGAGFPADIYVCNTAGTWTDSGADYDGDSVDLTDYATKAEVNQLEAKVTDIEVDDTSTDDNEIVIETDGGTQVLKVDENGLEVENINAENIDAEKLNAEQAEVEEMVAKDLAIKDGDGEDIFKAEASTDAEGEEEVLFETNAGKEIARIKKEGVSVSTKFEVKDSAGTDILMAEEVQVGDSEEEISILSGADKVVGIKPDGLRAKHFFVFKGNKEREILAPPTNMKYAEIGDSITFLADNKYETSYDDSGTTLTGYKGWGYGRYLCKYLGIPYENHYPQGANGRGFSTYCKEWIVDGHWSFPDNINVWTIFLGTNDWGLARTPLGTKDDYIGDTWTVSNQTTYGAIRKIVDKIRSQNTNGDPPQIIFITPLQRGAFLYGATAEQAESVFVKSAITINADGEYEYTQNAYGYTLKDVVDAILWVCEYESFKCVDWFNKSIFDKASLNMAQEFSEAGWDTTHIFGTVEIDGMRDNLHPKPGGKIYKLMGARLANEIADRFHDAFFE